MPTPSVCRLSTMIHTCDTYSTIPLFTTPFTTLQYSTADQVRIHADAIGLPLVNDLRYGRTARGDNAVLKGDNDVGVRRHCIRFVFFCRSFTICALNARVYCIPLICHSIYSRNATIFFQQWNRAIRACVYSSSVTARAVTQSTLHSINMPLYIFTQRNAFSRQPNRTILVCVSFSSVTA
jgi:hypothetical protein